jgi:signal transduction histidine kinase
MIFMKKKKGPHKRPRITLRLKLIVLFTVVYTTFMSIFIYLDLSGVHRLIEEEMKRTSVSFTKTLAFSVGGALSTGNTELLRRYIRMASEEQYVQEIVVQDGDNVVLASTGGRLDGQVLEDDISREFRSMDEVLLEEVGTPPKDLLHQSGHAFSVAVPISIDGKTEGLVRVVTFSRELNQKIMELGNRWILFTSISIIVGGVVATLLAWSVTTKLRKLVNSSMKIASGDLSERVAIHSSDELSDLGEAFNTMAVRLEESHSNLEKQVEKRTAELFESKRKLEGLFNGITDLISVQDGNYNILMANDAASHILQLPPDGIIGKKCYEIYCNEERPCKNCPIRKSKRTNEPAYSEVRHQGEILHLYTYPIVNDRGELESVIEFGKIVTKEKVLEEQLLQSAKLASLGELASTVAHEVRNPLAGIKTGVQFIEKRVKEQNEAGEVYRMILTEIYRLEEVVDKFLSFARPSKSVLRDMKIQDVIEKSISIADERIKKQNVTLKRKYDENLPASPVDEKQIEQVFLNLVINALQAMPDGGTLFLKTYRLDNSIHIEISDTGAGIPRDKLQDIFDPFFTTRAQGTGLGLSITKRIIEEHKGAIRVDSEEGRGTTFTLELPVDD